MSRNLIIFSNNYGKVLYLINSVACWMKHTNGYLLHWYRSKKSPSEAWACPPGPPWTPAMTTKPWWVIPVANPPNPAPEMGLDPHPERGPTFLWTPRMAPGVAGYAEALAWGPGVVALVDPLIEDYRPPLGSGLRPREKRPPLSPMGRGGPLQILPWTEHPWVEGMF